MRVVAMETSTGLEMLMTPLAVNESCGNGNKHRTGNADDTACSECTALQGDDRVAAHSNIWSRISASNSMVETVAKFR